MLGAMPWPEDLVTQLAGEGVFLHALSEKPSAVWPAISQRTFTPPASRSIEKNLRNPAWAIPRHLKLTVPRDAKRPLTGEQTTSLGPFYDPAQDKMLGGIINTFSNTAFAETTFGLISMQKRVAARVSSTADPPSNRAAVDEWLERHELFEHGVPDKARRGTSRHFAAGDRPGQSPIPPFTAKPRRENEAASRLRGIDPSGRRARARARRGALRERVSGHAGETFRAWIGGARPVSDIVALLDNIEYCYLRAKVIALEEQLAARGSPVSTPPRQGAEKPVSDPATLDEVRSACERLTAFWGAVSSTQDEARRAELLRAVWNVDDPRSGAADGAHSRV